MRSSRFPHSTFQSSICSPLPKSVDVNKYPHLQDKLVERSENRDPIDVLIGLDHYWEIVTGDAIHRGEFRHKQQVWFASL